MIRVVRRTVAAGLLAFVPALSCANVESPPGSAPDFAPPDVRERYPAPDAVVPGLDGDAFLRFDEPIQSPRSLERQLDYSPAWDWRFTPTTNGFKVRPREGWRPGVVYRIRLAPGVTDLLRNRTTGAVEWSFSTGPEIPRTRVEGTIFDRVSVAGVRDARLLFLPADSTPYTVVSDTGGVYSMRGLPPGDYAVFGFVDQNGNRRLDDSFEPWDSARVVIADATTRIALDLWMIPPDSTPPALTGASVADSLTVLLALDDPIDPVASLEAASASLLREDGTAGPAVASIVVGAPEPAAAAAGAAADSVPAAGDSLAADTAAAQPVDGRPAVGRPDAPGRQDGADRPGVPGAPGVPELRRTDLPPAPSTTVTLRLESPLATGTWRVRASGLPNLRGLVGGGDTTFVHEPPPPPPPNEGAEEDAGGAAPDSAAPAPAPAEASDAASAGRADGLDDGSPR